MEKILIIFMILNSGFAGTESVTEKRNLSDQQSSQLLVQDLTENDLALIGDKLFSSHNTDLTVSRFFSSRLIEENSIKVFNLDNRGIAGYRKTWLENSFMSVNEKGIYETSENERGRIKRWLVPAIVTVGSGILIYTLYRVRGN